MKKLSILIIFLTLTVTSCRIASADIISVPAFSADSGVSHLEYFRTTVVNVVNGNIQGAGGTGATRNVASDSIAELDMYDDANPRLRDADLLSIGVDSFASGSLTQNSFVKSGGTIATSASLSSTVTASVVYINGYRISTGATAQTFIASKDTYVDISQNGVFTLSPVTNGATQPAVASNSARLAKVVTDGTTITSVTDLANRRLPGLTVPANYRTGLIVSKDSTTTVKVFPGTCEINNTMLTKTSPTTLTISTPGDWAGGSSLRAANTYAFVGEDASGNLRLHTTQPAYDNYAVSTTDGKKRYATWAGTVYRILGWLYMDGGQFVEVASNLKEFDVSNMVISNDASTLAISSAGTYNPISRLPFYNSGGNVLHLATISADVSTGMSYAFNILDSATEIPGSDFNVYDNSGGGVLAHGTTLNISQIGPSQASRTYVLQAKTTSVGTYTQRRKLYSIIEQ